MATPLGMEARGKLPPPKMPCTHIWECAPANGLTSRGVCRLCKAEKDFANALPSGPESYKKIVLKGSKPKPRKGVEEMPTVDVNARGKQLKPLREAAAALFRAGKTAEELRQMPEFQGLPSSTLSGWKGRFGKRDKESTTVRTPALKPSGRDAQDKSTSPPVRPAPDFRELGDLLVGIGLVLVGSWMKRMGASADGR